MKMKNRTILVGILFVLSCATSVFAETKIVAQVDKTEVTTDDTLTYKLTITSNEKNIPAPTLPKFNGFNIISHLKSSQLSVRQGKTTVTLVYNIILSPKEEGTFEIEPSQIKIKNEVYSSEAFTIKVEQGRATPKSEPEPFIPKELEPESGQPQIIL